MKTIIVKKWKYLKILYLSYQGSYYTKNLTFIFRVPYQVFLRIVPFLLYLFVHIIHAISNARQLAFTN